MFFVGLILILLIAVRAVASVLGFKLRPWLPVSGPYRYYIDALITATLLLCLLAPIGLHPSFVIAIGIVFLASVVALVLENRRKAQRK